MAKAATPETDSALRMGAKAKRLIASIDKPQAEINAAVEKATTIARDRGDNILRDYYIYLALNIEMPEKTKREWEHFEKTGKELTGTSGGGTTKAKATPTGQKKAATSGNAGDRPAKESFKPDPKPSSKQSAGRSKQSKQSTGAKATPSSGSTAKASSEKSATGTGLPSSA